MYSLWLLRLTDFFNRLTVRKKDRLTVFTYLVTVFVNVDSVS